MFYELYLILYFPYAITKKFINKLLPIISLINTCRSRDDVYYQSSELNTNTNIKLMKISLMKIAHWRIRIIQWHCWLAQAMMSYFNLERICWLLQPYIWQKFPMKSRASSTIQTTERDGKISIGWNTIFILSSSFKEDCWLCLWPFYPYSWWHFQWGQGPVQQSQRGCRRIYQAKVKGNLPRRWTYFRPRNS